MLKVCDLCEVKDDHCFHERNLRHLYVTMDHGISLIISINQRIAFNLDRLLQSFLSVNTSLLWKSLLLIMAIAIPSQKS